MENQFTNAAFNSFLIQHRLMGSRDTKTGEIFLPPRPINPTNYSVEMEWVELSGRGVLQAFTNVYINSSRMLEAGFSRTNPCVVGIVKTEEGPLISALIVGLDGSNPQAVKIGVPLKVKYIDQGDGENQKTLLAFEPA